MSPEFIAAAEAEEAELATKLAAVRAVLAAYGRSPVKAAEAKPKQASNVQDSVSMAAQVRPLSSAWGDRPKDQFTPYGWEVVKAAVRVVREAKSLPIKTRAITEGVQAKGIEIRGNDPVNALGALLARCSGLESLGKKGWTLTAGADTGPYAPEKIEASNGNAAGASTAEGAATPSFENRLSLSLVG